MWDNLPLPDPDAERRRHVEALVRGFGRLRCEQAEWDKAIRSIFAAGYVAGVRSSGTQGDMAAANDAATEWLK